MPRKPIPPQDSFVDMPFPTKGIDLSKGFGSQQPGTTPVGQNVRAFDPLTARARGGQRPGLARYISTQVNGTNLIQDLTTVVGVGYASPGSGTQIPTVVQSSGSPNGGSGITTVTTPFTNPVTSGNMLIVLATEDASAITALADTGGNIYTRAVKATNGTKFAEIWYSQNVNGGGSFSVTATYGGATGSGLVAVEVSGLANVPLDQTSANTGAASPATPGAITTTQAEEIVFAVIQNVGGAITTPAGWTSIFSIPGGGEPTDSDYRVFSTIQAGLNPSWTLASTTAWAACQASFKAAGGTTPQTAVSGRVVTLAAVSNGAVKIVPAGGSAWTAAINATGKILNTSGVIFSAVNNQKIWYADGRHWLYYDPATNSVLNWTASAGTLPADSDGNTPRLIETWRGRTVVSGLLKDAQNWFMSAVGDPTNWNYFPTPVTPTQAVAGNNSTLGVVGDVITTMIPYSDDLLIFGGDHTIWICNGDPMAGGQINRVSDTIGMAWGMPWCKGPDGTVYFFSNKMGVYTMQPGQQPVRMSQQIEQLLSGIDTGANIIRLLWDDPWQGLHIFVTNASAAGATTHFFWEQRTGAWWTDVFTLANMNPLACVTFDGNTPTDRHPLIGSWDGYVRTLTPTATTDDGTAIASSVTIGPLLTKDLDDVLLKDLQAVLATASGVVSYAVYVAATAEGALAAVAVASGSWSAGRNLNTFVRRAGHAIYVKITATNAWALETIRCRVQGLGKTRRRGA